MRISSNLRLFFGIPFAFTKPSFAQKRVLMRFQCEFFYSHLRQKAKEKTFETEVQIFEATESSSYLVVI